MNTTRCYRTIQSEYSTVDECYIDLSLRILDVDQTRIYSCITKRKAATLLAQLPAE